MVDNTNTQQLMSGAYGVPKIMLDGGSNKHWRFHFFHSKQKHKALHEKDPIVWNSGWVYVEEAGIILICTPREVKKRRKKYALSTQKNCAADDTYYADGCNNFQKNDYLKALQKVEQH